MIRFVGFFILFSKIIQKKYCFISKEYIFALLNFKIERYESTK